MSKIKSTIKQYQIVHKGTTNPAFSHTWKVYPSAWIDYKYAGCGGKNWGNLPDNWRDLYDVICTTYVTTETGTEVVTR